MLMVNISSTFLSLFWFLSPLVLGLFIKRAGNLTLPPTTSKYSKEQNKHERVRKMLLDLLTFSLALSLPLSLSPHTHTQSRICFHHTLRISLRRLFLVAYFLALSALRSYSLGTVDTK